MRFSKMHGIGNDYIFINSCIEKVDNPGLLAKMLSDRHFYIGSDGLVLIGASSKADFSMRIFNPDGTEAEMCGNALRCVGKYVYDKGLHNKDCVAIETLAGIKHLELDIKKGKVVQVRVNMGIPVLDPKMIPVNIQGNAVIDYPLEVQGQTYYITAVSMGNPHCVIFTGKLSQLPAEAALISSNAIFPNRTNVEFVTVRAKDEIELLVYERGAGETLACGTGACASFYAARIKGLVGDTVKAKLKGGTLYLEQVGDSIFMTGPAQLSYEGEY